MSGGASHPSWVSLASLINHFHGNYLYRPPTSLHGHEILDFATEWHLCKSTNISHISFHSTFTLSFNPNLIFFTIGSSWLSSHSFDNLVLDLCSLVVGDDWRMCTPYCLLLLLSLMSPTVSTRNSSQSILITDYKTLEFLLNSYSNYLSLSWLTLWYYLHLILNH